MIPHSLRPRTLKRYADSVPASATVVLGVFEVPPNKSLAFAAKGNQTFNLRATQVDPDDLVEFDSDDFEVTSSAPSSGYLRSSTGAVKVSIVNGDSPLTPDIRIYGMEQP